MAFVGSKKVSNVFNGQCYDKGQFIALPFLDELDYHKALDEAKEAPVWRLMMPLICSNLPRPIMVKPLLRRFFAQ